MNTRAPNVGQAERLAAGILAIGLLARSVKVSHPLGLIAAGCLVYRALTGHCYGYDWLGVRTCKLPSQS